jgi:hypothetical protein
MIFVGGSLCTGKMVMRRYRSTTLSDDAFGIVLGYFEFC